jgi:phage shock protein C
MKKKLRRDGSEKMVGGVLAGFAAYSKSDVTVWRIGTVLLALVTAVLPVVVFYIFAWFIMPDKDDAEYTVVD